MSHAELLTSQSQFYSSGNAANNHSAILSIHPTDDPEIQEIGKSIVHRKHFRSHDRKTALK
jgi:hypothetical protein